MKQKHLYILAGFLIFVGLACFLYKVSVLDYPLSPDKQTRLWTLEADVSLNVKRGPIKVELMIPRPQSNLVFSNESFISRGFGLSTKLDGGNRKAIWSKRKGSGKYHLYYRTVVRLTDKMENADTENAIEQKKKPELILPTLLGTHREASEAVIAEMFEKSADVESFVGTLLQQLNEKTATGPLRVLIKKVKTLQDKVELTVQLLSLAGIPAREVHGVQLKPIAQNSLTHWLEVYDNDKWISFDPISGSKGVPPDYMVWWRGSMPLMKYNGAIFGKVEFSAVHSESESLSVLSDQNDGTVPLFYRFSLFSLPLKTQEVYRIILMIPIGAFLVVLFRNIIGYITFGTFMPILIALAFRETQLISGIMLFILVVSLGLTVRLYFEHLKLLVVPRLAAILTVVVLLMAMISIVTHLLGLEQGLSIALFPMVIMTMVIERMSIIWDETGPADAIKHGIGTLFMASIAYLVMNIGLLDHLIFVFPELLLIVLALILLAGRYSGYRLMELIRFKALTGSNKDKDTDV